MSEKPTPAAPKKAASTKAAAAPAPTEPEQAPVPTAPEPTIEEPPTSAGIGGLRIVVAEDEALIRLDLAEMLAELGYDVVGQASDGEQAVALVHEHRPDVVIMDVKMPVLDGISAAEQIGKERIAPVIMLTAFSQKELVERARDAASWPTSSSRSPRPTSHRRSTSPRRAGPSSRRSRARSPTSASASRPARRSTGAKGILMTRLKLSEADAFRWIQKTAMDRRLGMREVADAVISQMPATK